MSFKSLEINLEDLYLDEKNPRFIIPPNPTQQSIINYLIEFEEVEQLALDINESGGLFAGERVIAIKEKDKYIVLEGNRRICACKILMNPNLLRNIRPGSIEKIITKNNTKNNISKISVDVMNSRTEAQSALAAKHIDGIKKWSSISKQKFFVQEFNANKTIDEIKIMTGITKSKIIAGIKNYKIIEYVLNLPSWNQYEKDTYLSLHDIKISRLLRLFNSKTQNLENPKLSELIGLNYDDKYQITTNLKKEQFDKILHILASAAFIPHYCEEFKGTRSTYEDIPQLMNYFNSINLLEKYNQKNSNNDYNTENCNEKNNTDNKDNECNKTNVNSDNNTPKSTEQYKNNVRNNSKEQPKATTNNSSKRNFLIPEAFNTSCKDVKINNIINELKKLNLNQYINAPAVLLRVLVDISQKFYLEKIGKGDKIDSNNIPGNFNKTIKYMLDKKQIENIVHSNLTNLSKDNRIFNIFNGYIHNNSILPNKESLIYTFDNLQKFFEVCLNT